QSWKENSVPMLHRIPRLSEIPTVTPAGIAKLPFFEEGKTLTSVVSPRVFVLKILSVFVAERLVAKSYTAPKLRRYWFRLNSESLLKEIPVPNMKSFTYDFSSIPAM